VFTICWKEKITGKSSKFLKNFYGRCWKQKSFPIRVFRLQRAPVLVRATHWLAELVPAVFFGFDIMPETARNGGSQILQG
jgi:hypothetical protein